MTVSRPIAVFFGPAVFGAIVTLGALAFASAVDDDHYARSTLRGLEGVYVAVEPLSPEIERQGLAAATLKTDTELRLRLAGIRVLSRKEWTKTKGGPVCYVEVNIVKDVVFGDILGFALYAYEISVEFNQDVFLVRDTTNRVLSPTWSRSYLGVTNSLERIRGKVKEVVERFVEAYVEVNPGTSRLDRQ